MQSDTRRYLIAAVLLFAGAGLAWAARSLRPTQPGYQVDFASVPLEINGYKGKSLPMDESIYAMLKAGAMEERVYVRGEEQIHLTLIYGADWRTIHAPTGCYPAQGWQIIHNKVIELPAPPDCPHPGPLQARLLDATKGDARELALFVYARPRGTTADWTEQGLRVATGPPGAGGLIVTLRARVGGGDVSADEKALAEFMTAIYPKAVAFWYQDGRFKSDAPPSS